MIKIITVQKKISDNITINNFFEFLQNLTCEPLKKKFFRYLFENLVYYSSKFIT